jgi:hypothetical protein
MTQPLCERLFPVDFPSQALLLMWASGAIMKLQ